MTAVLYNGNTFRVYINARSHHENSLSSPLIFGLFGDPHLIHLTRDFRRIRLTLDINDLDTYGIIRIRSRVQYLVDTLKKYAGDETRKSLLKGLHIRLLLHGHHLEYNRRCKYLRKGHRQQRLETGNRHIMRHMFTLEPLAQLHALDEIRLVGCPAWFTECLLLRLRGDGGPLSELKWPTKIERRVRASKRYKKAEVSTRQCWQPVYDWAGFANRNGIAVPDEAAEFFP